MNLFGIVLKVGTHGVYRPELFYKGYLPKDKKVPESERTFVIEGGTGREPKGGNSKVTGHWLSDGMQDTIDSYSLDYVIVGEKKIKRILTGDPPPDPTPVVSDAEVLEHERQDAAQKPVRRKRG